MDSIINRLVQGAGTFQQNDHNNWNQSVGSIPPDQFAQASTQAFQQVNPQDYYEHTQPGVAGTNPFGQIQPTQRVGLVQSLLQSLFSRGIDQQQVMQGTGLGALNPEQMSPEQIAALAQWIQRNHPEALGQVAAQYQNQPDLLSSLMGNKTLLALGALLGASYLSHRNQG